MPTRSHYSGAGPIVGPGVAACPRVDVGDAELGIQGYTFRVGPQTRAALTGVRGDLRAGERSVVSLSPSGS